MSQHEAGIAWSRGHADFLARKYSRAHEWRFDGGAVVAASSSPSVVPLPYSDPAGVDPEEAFVASVASCHLLWFLDVASRAGYVVDSYRDQAIGRMAPNEDGHLWVAEVELRPEVAFGGTRQPDEQQHMALHHKAHEACFIANSIRSTVRVRPVAVDSGATAGR